MKPVPPIRDDEPCGCGERPCLLHFAQLDGEDRHAWLTALGMRDPVEKRVRYAAQVGEERREKRLARGR